jgi:hypothetical protein
LEIDKKSSLKYTVRCTEEVPSTEVPSEDQIKAEGKIHVFEDVSVFTLRRGLDYYVHYISKKFVSVKI